MNTKQARKLPHLNFSPQEWWFSTRFYTLSARGLLIDLASIQWMRGAFPADRGQIERLVGCVVEESVWLEVSVLFVPVPGGVGLQWIEDERLAAIERVEAARRHGSRGGRMSAMHGVSRVGGGVVEGGSGDTRPISNYTGLNRTEEKSASLVASTGVAARRRSKPKDELRWTAEGGWQGINDIDRAMWSKAFPACDVARQLAAAEQWLLANPAKAKKSAWRRFVTSWLSRAQDRGGDVDKGSQMVNTTQRGSGRDFAAEAARQLEMLGGS